MKLTEIRLGMLVQRHGGESSLLRDAARSPNMRGRRTATVIGFAGASKILVRWNGTNNSEPISVHRLQEVSLEEAPVEPVPGPIEFPFRESDGNPPITHKEIAPGRLQLAWAFPGIATPWALRLPSRRARRKPTTTANQLELPIGAK